MDRDKFISTLKNTNIPNRYQMVAHEIVDIYAGANQDWCRSIILGFRYGFLKGQRYEKAKAKKKGKENE